MAKDDTQLPTTQEPGSQPGAGDGGVPQGGTPAGGKTDVATSIDPKKFVPVTDINKMKSVYDRQLADQQRKFDALQNQYNELQAWREKNETEGLTDEELALYEAQREQYKAQRAIEDTRRQRDQLEYERNFMALRNYYLGKGAPQEIINLEDPTEMQEAFLNWQNERYAKLEERLKQIESGSGETDKSKQPPPVTTHKPAAGAPGKLKWADIKLGSKEEAKLLADLDAGLIKPEDIS